MNESENKEKINCPFLALPPLMLNWYLLFININYISRKLIMHTSYCYNHVRSTMPTISVIHMTNFKLDSKLCACVTLHGFAFTKPNILIALDKQRERREERLDNLPFR